MKKYLLFTGSVTFAQKGRELLKHRGIKAYLKRVQGNSAVGCGYAVVVSDRALNLAQKVFLEFGIPLREIREDTE